MEIIFEFLFSFLGEFVLQVLGEVFVEVGLHSLAEPFRKEPRPWLAAVGYVVFGAVIGGLSLLVFPHHLVASKGLRVANAALSPIVAGLSVAALGAWRARRVRPCCASTDLLTAMCLRWPLGWCVSGLRSNSRCAVLPNCANVQSLWMAERRQSVAAHEPA